MIKKEHPELEEFLLGKLLDGYFAGMVSNVNWEVVQTKKYKDTSLYFFKDILFRRKLQMGASITLQPK